MNLSQLSIDLKMCFVFETMIPRYKIHQNIHQISNYYLSQKFRIELRIQQLEIEIVFERSIFCLVLSLENDFCVYFNFKEIISAFNLGFDNRRLKQLLKRLYSFVSSLVFILHLHVFNVPPSFATNSKQKRILALFKHRRQLFFHCLVVIFEFNDD